MQYLKCHPFHRVRSLSDYAGAVRKQPALDQMNVSSTCNVEEVSTEKDLGVEFDNLLAFDAQCDTMVKKANKVLCTIRRSFHYLDKEVMLQLY